MNCLGNTWSKKKKKHSLMLPVMMMMMMMKMTTEGPHENISTQYPGILEQKCSGFICTRKPFPSGLIKLN